MQPFLPTDENLADDVRPLSVEERIRLVRTETFFGHAVGNMVGILLGGAIFAVTAWLSLLGMWLGAGLTDRLVDKVPPSGN